MEILTNEPQPSSCEACGVKDCPTRGMLDTGKECELSPRSMVIRSLAVFVVPLLGAFVGAAYGENGTVVQLAGAAGGFLAGTLLAMMGMRFFHGK